MKRIVLTLIILVMLAGSGWCGQDAIVDTRPSIEDVAKITYKTLTSLPNDDFTDKEQDRISSLEKIQVQYKRLGLNSKVAKVERELHKWNVRSRGRSIFRYLKNKNITLFRVEFAEVEEMGLRQDVFELNSAGTWDYHGSPWWPPAHSAHLIQDVYNDPPAHILKEIPTKHLSRSWIIDKKLGSGMLAFECEGSLVKTERRTTIWLLAFRSWEVIE